MAYPFNITKIPTDFSKNPAETVSKNVLAHFQNLSHEGPRYIISTYMHHIYFIKYTPFSRNPIELRRKLE